MKKLYKSRTDVKIDGVCSGIAKYLDIDVTVVRLLWILFGFFSVGVVAYIICMFLMPREPVVVDYTNQYDGYSN